MSPPLLPLGGLVSCGFALASVALFGVALGFDPAAGAQLTSRVVDAAPGDAAFLKWGAIADLLGYYLLPAGLLIVVAERLPWPNRATRDVATIGLIVYATIGAVGAGVVAAGVAPLVEGGGDASLTAALTSLVEAAWQWVEPLPFLAWAAAMAVTFRRAASSWTWAFATLAAAAMLVWFGRVFDMEPVLIAGLVLWLLPFPFVFAAIGSWARSPA